LDGHPCGERCWRREEFDRVRDALNRVVVFGVDTSEKRGAFREI
jgi:hypothetical protein